MSLVGGIIGFAVLFAVFGVYGLASTRRACSGSCSSCGASAGCRSEDDGQGHAH
jgi:hypothetical protein